MILVDNDSTKRPANVSGSNRRIHIAYTLGAEHTPRRRHDRRLVASHQRQHRVRNLRYRQLKIIIQPPPPVPAGVVRAASRGTMRRTTRSWQIPLWEHCTTTRSWLAAGRRGAGWLHTAPRCTIIKT